MTNPYRALCAELVDDLELCDWPYKLKDTIRADIERAHLLLNQTEPEDRSQISDGYHTFAELYEHRHALMLALMHAKPTMCWFSRRHSDGELPFGSKGWFIAGVELPAGAITYHLPTRLLCVARATGATELTAGKPWDGHTANDVVTRLTDWALSGCPAHALPVPGAEESC